MRDGVRTADQQPGVFRGDRGRGDAVDLHAEEQYENQVQCDIRKVDREHDIKGNAGVLQPDEPPDQCVIGQRRRRAPDTDKEVLVGVFRDIGIRPQEAHR